MRTTVTNSSTLSLAEGAFNFPSLVAHFSVIIAGFADWLLIVQSQLSGQFYAVLFHMPSIFAKPAS